MTNTKIKMASEMLTTARQQSTEKCFICLDDLPIKGYISLPCCGKIPCFSCFNTNFQNKKECPHCRADLKQFYSVQSTNSIELEDISPYSNRFCDLLLDNLSADDTQELIETLVTNKFGANETQVLIEALVLDKFWPNYGFIDARQ